MSENLLFIRSGVLCSAPSGFYEELAENYDTEVHSAKQVRLQLRKQGLKGGALADGLQHTLLEMTAQSLQSGANVYHEGYLNAFNRRREMRQVAAEISGVKLVHLVVDTPMSIIRERITARYPASDDPIESRQAQAGLASDLWCAESMLVQLDWPSQSYEPHLRLDGSQTAAELLGQVDGYVARQTRASTVANRAPGT